MEERPNAKDRQISVFWQAFLSGRHPSWWEPATSGISGDWSSLSPRCMAGRASVASETPIEEDESRTRQAISHFLTRAEWDAPELLRQAALDKLRELGWKAGETLYAIIDDTQKRKRGKRMDAVCRLFLHAEKVYAKGHTIVGLRADLSRRSHSLRGAVVGQQGVLQGTAALGTGRRTRKIPQIDATGGRHGGRGVSAVAGQGNCDVRLLLPLPCR